MSGLSVKETLRGKRILFTGATGFVGKVALSMLLDRYPEVGKVYVLARPGISTSAEERFYRKVAVSPPFDPLRARYGPQFEAFLREKCEPIPGDVSKKWCAFSDELLDRLAGHVDLLVNSAGLVDFNPTLEAALNANALGALHVAETAHRLGARLVHVSTCFVAGNHTGYIPEDPDLVGYFPKREERPGEVFDPFAEIEDCKATVERIKAQADDKALLSEFRARALERIHEEGRDETDAKAIRTGTMRERRMWVTEQLIRAGTRRAQEWGWPNTYCYTKSLGDQVIDAFAKGTGLRFAIVRPAIVESSLRFPFPGWNEGFTTTAPLTFLALKGHRTYPAKKGLVLDVIPADHIAAGLIAVGAALLADRAEKVYQLGTSDSNPLEMQRAIELTGLYRRRHYLAKAKEGERLKNEILARIEPQPVTAERYAATSAPRLAKLAKGLGELLDEVKPSWGAPRIAAAIERVQDELDEAAKRAEMAASMFDIFMAFVWENSYVFSSRNIRALHARMDPEDAAKLPWDPEAIDWLEYWLDIHLPGLARWVYPNLEDEYGVKTRKKGVPVYRDLWELLEARTRRHPGKVVMRLLRSDGTADRYTWGQLRDRAVRAAFFLAAAGVEPEDRVALVSENRPEWGMAYFGAIKAAATVVPLDHQSSREDLETAIRTAEAKAVIASRAVIDRLSLAGEVAGAKLLELSELFSAPLPATEMGALAPRDPVALSSLIFTSGTTGAPKGVMLHGRNFTTLVSKLSSIFSLGERDGLLSVLPLHHTFEFTAGFLVPLACGAEIVYLEEVNADSLGEAFATGRITAMVGVPALWQLLLRRIESGLAERGILQGAKALQRFTRRVGDRRLGRLAARAAFLPVHRKLGGRLRFLISGGSAMPPDVYEAYQGMGFDIYEGYGLTEAAPVLTVQTPGDNDPGHVGKPLPGIEVRIHEPDENGVGEVIARGPTIMAGYWRNPEATAEALRDGWLFTGDLGRFDEAGHLIIVGRRKDVIIDANGKNVYPDELEDRYGRTPLIKELSIVGLPDEHGGEKVACLAVPAYVEGESREERRRKVEAHIREVSLKLPLYKRIKVLHLQDEELPRTSTRKVKRKEVVEILQRLERRGRQGRRHTVADGNAWLYDLVARVSEQPREKVTPEARLENDLGFDSLMFAELTASLEEAGLKIPSSDEVASVATVGELAARVARWRKSGRARSDGEDAAREIATRRRRSSLFESLLDAVQPAIDQVPILSSAVAIARAEGLRFLDDLVPPPRRPKGEERAEAEPVELPELLVAAGKTVLREGQKSLYERIFETKVVGRAHVPRHVNFLVAANHASHLDMGLVKHALGEQGENLVALAARDYFFSSRLRRTYFENFTHLIPMDRQGSLRESLRLASRSLQQGRNLLIFPEGTRATDGTIKEFKASLGYLALTNKVGVLPIYLEGTWQALPKGSVVPKARDLGARIGPFLSYETLAAAVAGLPRSEQHREVARIVEGAVRALAEGRVPEMPPPRVQAPTLATVEEQAAELLAEPSETRPEAAAPEPREGAAKGAGRSRRGSEAEAPEEAKPRRSTRLSRIASRREGKR